MNGKTRRDRIRNDTVREREWGWHLYIVEKLIENRLRWFGQGGATCN